MLKDRKKPLRGRQMSNFWEFNVWGCVVLAGALLGSMLLGNAIKKMTPGLRESLIPTSVIGGLILLVIAEIYRFITGNELTPNFSAVTGFRRSR